MMHITDIESTPGNSKKVLLRIEGTDDLYLYKGDLRTLHLQVGDELTDDTYTNIVQDILIPRARKRALHLLERQDYSRSKLRQKLLTSHYPAEVCEDAISYVESYHYIDDERYARNYISYHKEDTSRRKLYQNLIKRGIDSSLAEAVLEEEYDTDQLALATRLLDKRGYDSSDADSALRNKMYRFLISRGFDSSVATTALQGEL